MYVAPLHYLATPYTSSDPLQQDYRAIVAAHLTVYLAEQGFPVVSPICHGVALTKLIPLCPDTSEFWDTINFPMLVTASRLVIAPMQGWQFSKGILRELIQWDEVYNTVFFVVPGETFQKELPDPVSFKEFDPSFSMNQLNQTAEYSLHSAKVQDVIAYVQFCQQLIGVSP